MPAVPTIAAVSKRGRWADIVDSDEDDVVVRRSRSRSRSPPQQLSPPLSARSCASHCDTEYSWDGRGNYDVGQQQVGAACLPLPPSSVGMSSSSALDGLVGLPCVDGFAPCPALTMVWQITPTMWQMAPESTLATVTSEMPSTTSRRVRTAYTKAPAASRVRGRKTFETSDVPANLQDGEWEGRSEKRRAAIQLIKSSPEYEALAARRSQPGRMTRKAPLTPNPANRTLSKRQWENDTMHWRVGLRRWYQGEFGGDELQS